MASPVIAKSIYNTSLMHTLYVKTHGHGAQHFVLLHGWAMHGGIFDPLVTQLATRATVHVVDLPGHGYSRDNPTPLEPLACSQAIVAATPPATWIGWSLGGVMAMAAAGAYPDHVQGLSIISSSPCFLSHNDWPYGRPLQTLQRFGDDLKQHYDITVRRFLALEAMGSKQAGNVAKSLEKTVLERGKPHPRIYAEGMATLQHTDLHTSMQHIRQPNVWIAGARDRMINPQAMAWSADQARGEFVRIAHAGHAAFIGFTDEVMNALSPLMQAL